MFTDTDKQAIAQLYKLAQAMNHTLEALSEPVAASDAGAALMGALDLDAASEAIEALMLDAGLGRVVRLPDILTPDEIDRALELLDVTKIHDELIAPNMERINASLGQTNDSRYLAYLVQHILTSTGHWPSESQ